MPSAVAAAASSGRDDPGGRRRAFACTDACGPGERRSAGASDGGAHVSTVDLARLQFAMHVDLPLPVRAADHRAGASSPPCCRPRGTAPDAPEYLRLTRFFGTLLVINVAVGVVTGLVQEFQFGMNWSGYSRFVGDVFGAPLAMEGLAAFFLESTFLGAVALRLGPAVPAGAPGHDLGGRGRRRAVGGVHHGGELVDAAPGRLHDQPDAGPGRS